MPEETTAVELVTVTANILHCVFSVFLCDESTNDMLLQQRASTKALFPNAWSNACHGHPSHGMEPSEVEVETVGAVDNAGGAEEEDVGGAGSSVGGVINAAARMLEHDLGIATTGQWKVGVSCFQSPSWGEHEINYVLIVTIPSKGAITIKPNVEEVDDVMWVSQSQLFEMFDDPTLLFSPWFPIIVKQWMVGSVEDGMKGAGWWNDLERAMKTDDFCYYGMIHRLLDPSREQVGGGGDVEAAVGVEQVEESKNEWNEHDYCEFGVYVFFSCVFIGLLVAIFVIFFLSHVNY